MSELPKIPGGRFRLRGREPEFVHAPEFGEAWFVLGSASRVRPGGRCLVRRWSENDHVTVTIGELVAERTVTHEPGSHYGTGVVRYVLATIDISATRERHARLGPRPPWLKR